MRGWVGWMGGWGEEPLMINTPSVKVRTDSVDTPGPQNADARTRSAKAQPPQKIEAATRYNARSCRPCAARVLVGRPAMDLLSDIFPGSFEQHLFSHYLLLIFSPGCSRLANCTRDDFPRSFTFSSTKGSIASPMTAKTDGKTSWEDGKMHHIPSQVHTLWSATPSCAPN